MREKDKIIDKKKSLEYYKDLKKRFPKKMDIQGAKQRIKDRRIQIGILQEHIADLLGMTKSGYSSAERQSQEVWNNKTKQYTTPTVFFTPEQLFNLSGILQISLEFIIEGKTSTQAINVDKLKLDLIAAEAEVRDLRTKIIAQQADITEANAYSETLSTLNSILQRKLDKAKA